MKLVSSRDSESEARTSQRQVCKKGHKACRRPQERASPTNYTRDIRNALCSLPVQHLEPAQGLTSFRFLHQRRHERPQSLGYMDRRHAPARYQQVRRATAGGRENPFLVVNIVGDFSGTFLSREECQAVMFGEMPSMIEHAAPVLDNDNDDGLPPAESD